ncbi:uracil phosphoribosyltransferase [Saccharicrinis fermentans]|uniref:Uracil phosphoribosyltransferase n=1 Tax=Saccharicrinis fermentans DSM 9555 = JCM 21142 TaxID=869213 RepID=W7YG55_9BACT|nr:uracil phosphoribosyltransferase [Saccharicrinis fermentans]GAF03426.1 uracil phosphoribosyltransferase [Saccharicrinis fermentans DSM 9555 = JCM 21142]
MNTHIFNKQNSLFNQFIAEIRDKEIQTDPLRFRRNIERMGEILAYEISKELNYRSIDIQTPLGVSHEFVHDENVVIATILRAGLPLHQGVLNYFDGAENCFVSAYRKYNEKGDFDIHIEYISSPSLDDKIVILTDPMLASGASMELAYKAILTKGTPKHIHIASIIASEEGVDYVQRNMASDNISLWIGAVDKELNEKKYIIPGLGDAGDLAFGRKL